MALSTNGTTALSIQKLMVYLGKAWVDFLCTLEQLLHALFSSLLTCNFHSMGAADSLFVETASLHSSFRPILYLRIIMLRKNNWYIKKKAKLIAAINGREKDLIFFVFFQSKETTTVKVARYGSLSCLSKQFYRQRNGHHCLRHIEVW